MNNLRERIKIREEVIKEINDFLLDPGNEITNRLLEIVEKYGGPDEINRKANEARKLDNLFARLKEDKSPYLKDLEWLTEQRESGAFIKLADYRKKILAHGFSYIDLLLPKPFFALFYRANVSVFHEDS